MNTKTCSFKCTSQTEDNNPKAVHTEQIVLDLLFISQYETCYGK